MSTKKYDPFQETIYQTNRVKDVGIAIILLFVFLAIVVGFATKTPTQEYLNFLAKQGGETYYNKFDGAKDTFNFDLFFTIGMSGVSLGSVFLIVGAIIERQNAILRVLIYSSPKKEVDVIKE